MALEHHTGAVYIGGGRCVHAVKAQTCMDHFGALQNSELSNQESALLECVLDPRISTRIDPKFRFSIVSLTALLPGWSSTSLQTDLALSSRALHCFCFHGPISAKRSLHLKVRLTFGRQTGSNSFQSSLRCRKRGGSPKRLC